jgi:hypothetical protein
MTSKEVFNFENGIIEESMKMEEIIAWNTKYAQKFQLETTPNTSVENISDNFVKILAALLKEAQTSDGQPAGKSEELGKGQQRANE